MGHQHLGRCQAGDTHIQPKRRLGSTGGHLLLPWPDRTSCKPVAHIRSPTSDTAPFSIARFLAPSHLFPSWFRYRMSRYDLEGGSHASPKRASTGAPCEGLCHWRYAMYAPSAGTITPRAVPASNLVVDPSGLSIFVAICVVAIHVTPCLAPARVRVCFTRAKRRCF